MRNIEHWMKHTDRETRIKYWMKHPGYECLAGEPRDVTDEIIKRLLARRKNSDGGQSMDEAAAENFGLTADDLDEEEEDDNVVEMRVPRREP
jgi:hypothetical protein